MTNPEWRERYENAHSGPTFIHDQEIASALDDAIGNLMHDMKVAGYPLPGDDRIENVVTELFKLAVDKYEEDNT